MSRLIAIVCAGAFALAVSGCGGKPEPAGQPQGGRRHFREETVAFPDSR